MPYIFSSAGTNLMQTNYEMFIMFITVVVSLAEYIGSILSYVILAIAIFTGRYDDLSSSQLASLISKVNLPAGYIYFLSDSMSAICI